MAPLTAGTSVPEPRITTAVTTVASETTRLTVNAVPFTRPCGGARF